MAVVSPRPELREPQDSDTGLRPSPRRSWSDTGDLKSPEQNVRYQRAAKRRKVEDFRASCNYHCDRSELTPIFGHSVWKLVLSHLPPRSLGKVLQVNKALYKLLGPDAERETRALPSSRRNRTDSATPLDSDLIWRTSRKKFHPGMPGPYHGSTELEIWKLRDGKICQLCNTKFLEPHLDSSGNRPTLKVIWQFQVRGCLPCLQKHTLQEKEIIEYPYLSHPGLLPYLAVSEKFEFLPLRASSPQCLKLYFQKDVLAILQAFRDAEQSGPVAVESLRERSRVEAEALMGYAQGWELMTMGQSDCLRLRSGGPEFENEAGREPSPSVLDSFSSIFPMDPRSSIDVDGQAILRPTTRSSSRLSSRISLGESESSEPVNRRLGIYADEIIHQAWNGGKNVTQENAASFAVSVLGVARSRFLRSPQVSPGPTRGLLDEEEELSDHLGQGIEPTDSITLRLRHMKWVYDHKIKPLAERHRKNIFRCSACRNPRQYTFEGVMLHYGAKHTNKFTMGSAVVDWHKADWPEELPLAAPVKWTRNTQSPAPTNASSVRVREFHPSFQSPRPGPRFYGTQPQLPSPFATPPIWQNISSAPTNIPQHIPLNSVAHPQPSSVQQGLHFQDGHANWTQSIDGIGEPECGFKTQYPVSSANEYGYMNGRSFSNPPHLHIGVENTEEFTEDENSERNKFKRYKATALQIAWQEERHRTWAPRFGPPPPWSSYSHSISRPAWDGSPCHPQSRYLLGDCGLAEASSANSYVLRPPYDR